MPLTRSYDTRTHWHIGKTKRILRAATLLLSLATSRAFNLAAAYAIGDRKYMQFPYGLEKEEDLQAACNYDWDNGIEINIPIYGLRDASISWFLHLDTYLKN